MPSVPTVARGGRRFSVLVTGNRFRLVHTQDRIARASAERWAAAYVDVVRGYVQGSARAGG